MAEELQVLYLALDTIVRVPTQLVPVNKLERNLLARLHMLGHCPVSTNKESAGEQQGDVRRTLPKEPSPRVLTMR